MDENDIRKAFRLDVFIVLAFLAGAAVFSGIIIEMATGVQLLP
jgi:hypothetical protein